MNFTNKIYKSKNSEINKIFKISEITLWNEINETTSNA